jgi:uncharacterized membrane protein
VSVQHPPATWPEPEVPDLEEELEAEHGLARSVVIGILVAVPVCIGVWVGLIGFAVSRAGASLAGPLWMAAGVGVLTGLLFGSWAGFVARTHEFEEMDRKVSHPNAGARRERQPPSTR